MNAIFDWKGQSFVLNTVFVIANLLGVTLITMGFHPNFEESQIILVSIGVLVLLLSIVGLIIFKGKIYMSLVSRVLVGGLFIVSGLIKANDPVGFSYKLEEYFEDGALAFRIKEWFGLPGFSLEFLIDFALFFSVLICIIEIVLGVLVLLGAKIKFTSWMLLLTMLFFTFLTWHTANCDPNKRFLDRDTYSYNDPLGMAKREEAKTNKTIKIVSDTKEEIVVDEFKQPQCVSDCGCFGDAMKGSVGRSLTPSESLWKDYLLVYFVVWIFILQKRIEPNTTKENVYILPISLLVVLFFSFVFGWYFPVFFAFLCLVTALWVNRMGGKYLGNYWGAALSVVLICVLFVSYVLRYEPMKDYRPYAVGSNLRVKMNDGIQGKYQSLLVYKNLKTGEEKEYDGSSQEYINSKIWEKTATWKYDTMVTKEIIATRLPSITSQFNPMITVAELGKEENKLPFIQRALAKAKREDQQLYDISLRDYITKAPLIYVLFSKDLVKINTNELDDIKQIFKRTQAKKIPFVLVSNATRNVVNTFRKKYKFNVPTFSNDVTELKAIARSNPALLVISNGVVKGKFPGNSIPSYSWIKKHTLSN
jgi:uncharacterized membrane protein YphA (DoxX/SURF4 family)/peroxiredoxin